MSFCRSYGWVWLNSSITHAHTLEPFSLVIKGESIANQTSWQGTGTPMRGRALQRAAARGRVAPRSVEFFLWDRAPRSAAWGPQRTVQRSVKLLFNDREPYSEAQKICDAGLLYCANFQKKPEICAHLPEYFATRSLMLILNQFEGASSFAMTCKPKPNKLYSRSFFYRISKLLLM